jgi:hypothetical protein
VAPPVSELALGLLFDGLLVVLPPCVPPVSVEIQAEDCAPPPPPVVVLPPVVAFVPVMFCCCARAGW